MLSKKIKPAVHELSFSIPDQQVGNTWGWVEFRELVGVVNDIHELAKEYAMSGKDVWAKYFNLSKDKWHLAIALILPQIEKCIFFNITKDGRILEFERLFGIVGETLMGNSPEGFSNALVKGDFFVPAGFASAVINEAEQERHGCLHRELETIEYTIHCTGDFCSQDDEAPGRLGHQCGNHITEKCVRCGAAISDSYDETCRLYDEHLENSQG